MTFEQIVLGWLIFLTGIVLWLAYKMHAVITSTTKQSQALQQMGGALQQLSKVFEELARHILIAKAQVQEAAESREQPEKTEAPL